MGLNTSSIILGFTGSIGSGCSYISEELPKITNDNYAYFKLSDILRNELEAEGTKKPDVDQLQNKGNDLRKEVPHTNVCKILGMGKLAMQ